MGTWTEHKHQQQETEKNTMKTFLLLTSLLAVAPVSQAAEVKLTLGEGFEKALLDLASGGQQKREEGFADDSDESQVKRELGFADDSDESQGEKRELDESDFLGGGGELDGLVDDLEQKREMGFADDSDESQGGKRELGSENKGLQGKRWLGCRNGYRSTTCYYTQSCQHYHYRHCTGGTFPVCSNQLRLRCLMVERRCARRWRCRYNHYYRYRPCYRCTYRRWWKNM
ncbi:uncharacterized protein LOC121307972 isoform X2 [Polyodon spathula]|uniref:uncharacterized protein LOC121307972 isoform X2 n=1 Tax=Polyodon spathula TaxID=7913 RepID=UPI001B7EE6F3|nr:uncharacterized protein LOC121307972 isoform X2 [Polyodon spathula]